MDLLVLAWAGWLVLVAAVALLVVVLFVGWWLWDQCNPAARAKRRELAQLQAWYVKQPGPKPWDDS